MRGRLPHYFTLTLNVKGAQLPLVFEGVLDMDEGYFEPTDVYLEHARGRVEGKEDYKLSEAVFNQILGGTYDEEINEAAWGRTA